jgi:hypothetical protein
MNKFANLKSDGLEEAQDRLGGSFTFETDVYEATIKLAYAGQSAAGALNVTISADINGQEFRETIYVTNKQGQNYFLNKQDNTKKVPLPGFTTVEHLCLIASDKGLADQTMEEKIVKIWDYDEKKEMPKAVDVLVDLIGQKVALGIVKQTVDINEKDSNGDYVPTGKTRDENTIDKVFDIESKLTVIEAMNGSTTGTFQDSWLTKNRGVTRDKTNKVAAGQSGQQGRPGGSAPQAGAKPAGKSLFGKK